MPQPRGPPRFSSGKIPNFFVQKLRRLGLEPEDPEGGYRFQSWMRRHVKKENETLDEVRHLRPKVRATVQIGSAPRAAS